MSYTLRGTHEVVIAGAQSDMFVIDVDKGAISQRVSAVYAAHGSNMLIKRRSPLNPTIVS